MQLLERLELRTQPLELANRFETRLQTPARSLADPFEPDDAVDRRHEEKPHDGEITRQNPPLDGHALGPEGHYSPQRTAGRFSLSAPGSHGILSFKDRAESPGKARTAT